MATTLIATWMCWSDQDVKELCQRIRKALPLDDPQKLMNHTGVLDWKMISFNHHTPIQCKKKWMQMLRPVKNMKIQLVKSSPLISLSKASREKWLKSVVNKKGGMGRTAEAICKRYNDRIRALNPNLYPDEPPRPPRNARNFYWITLPNYPNISKNNILQRWKNLTPPWKAKYTAMFKEKQAEYLKEFEKFLRNLPRKELPKFRSVLQQRNCATDVESSEDEDQ